VGARIPIAHGGAKDGDEASSSIHGVPGTGCCAAHERRDWLPAGLELDWLEELRARHVELAQAWAAAVARVGEIREDVRVREADHRGAVRRALAASEELPLRPDDLDPARRDALVAIAVEEANDARDDLSEFVLEALATLRAHRPELRPHLPALSPVLLSAVSAGSAISGRSSRSGCVARPRRSTGPGSKRSPTRMSQLMPDMQTARRPRTVERRVQHLFVQHRAVQLDFKGNEVEVLLTARVASYRRSHCPRRHGSTPSARWRRTGTRWR